MTSFKHYLTKAKVLTESSYGITHIEDLPVETFISILKKLPTLRCVQKLDGANLLAGVDVDGNFYTSREQKGGKRFYRDTDYPKTPTYDGFKSAHIALTKVEDVFKKFVKPGQALSCEVLFGEQPNTVIYGKDGKSWVAFLEPVQGDDPTKELNWKLPKLLTEALKGKDVVTNLPIADTEDGVNIIRAPKPVKWGFTKSDVVPKEEFLKVDIKPELAKLEKFLDKSCQAAHDEGFDLTNLEVLKSKGKLSKVKQQLADQVRDEFMKPIKAKFMKLVMQQKPSLRGALPNGYKFDEIEGLIFTDRETGEKFKVVDRDAFTSVNKFNYQVRNRIAGRVATSNEDMSLEAQGGIMGVARSRCMRLFGLDNLELPSQTLRVLSNFKGSTRKDTEKNLEQSISANKNFQAVKRKMSAIITSAMQDLDEELDEFKKTADETELNLENGKTLTYTPEVKRRTMMVFAESFNDGDKMLKAIRKAEDFVDLLKVFIDKKLDDVQEMQAKADEKGQDETVS